jgi:glycosyltransferase involved in cell wall biosynthesis
MTFDPFVTIITPTYNHENFISTCIESVLSQTYQNWEQIIIDDGSTDNTRDIISQYSDERIKYLRQENVGIWRLHETYNIALHLSHGNLIAILEGDDFWAPDKLDKQVPLFTQPEIVLAFGRVTAIDPEGKPLFNFPSKNKVSNNLCRYKILNQLLIENFIPSCTVICRKTTLDSIGGFKQANYTPFVDYPTWLELSLKGCFLMDNSILGFYRQHLHQVSNVMREKMPSGPQYAMEFYQNLPKNVKSSLDITIREIEEGYRTNLALNYYLVGRDLLLKKCWHQARRNFFISLKKGNFFYKIKSILGIIFSIIRA